MPNLTLGWRRFTSNAGANRHSGDDPLTESPPTWERSNPAVVDQLWWRGNPAATDLEHAPSRRADPQSVAQLGRPDADVRELTQG